MNLLFIELMSHLSYVKQMWSQSIHIHLTYELILCIQITSRRYILIQFKKQRVLAGTEFSSLWPSDPDLVWYSWLHTVRPHSSGQSSGGPLCSSHLQTVRNTVQTFPEPLRLERVCCPSAWLTCSRNGARLCFLSAAPGVCKKSPIQVLSRLNVA